MEERVEHAIMYYPGSFIGAANGSQVRALGLLSFLQAHFSRVSLYSLASDPPWTPADREFLASKFPSVRLVVEQVGVWTKWAARLKKIALMLFPGSARPILTARIAGQSPCLDRLVRESEDHVLCVNYVDNLSKLNGIEPARCVVETHDIQFLRRAIGGRRGPLSVASYARLRAEFGAVSAVAGAVGISRNETYLLRSLAPSTPSFYIPDYDPKPPVDCTSSDHRYDLLFVASSNIINQRGFRDLLDRSELDLVRYRIAICGSLCSVPSIRDLAQHHSNVTLLGFVDDLLALYAASKACLCPTTGTGLNIKILEALQHGKAVFASRSAMDALADGYGECVFRIGRAEFARILDDPHALARAKRAAHAYYRSFTSTGDLGDYARHLSGLARKQSGAIGVSGPVSSVA